MEGSLARVLGLAASGALHLGSDRGHPAQFGGATQGRLMRWAELALFLVPFALYAAWRLAAVLARPALVWAALAAALALAGGTVWLGLSWRADPTLAYVPARIEDGKI